MVYWIVLCNQQIQWPNESSAILPTTCTMLLEFVECRQPIVDLWGPPLPMQCSIVRKSKTFEPFSTQNEMTYDAGNCTSTHQA